MWWWPMTWWWISIDWRLAYSGNSDEKGVVIYVDFKRRRKQ